MYYVSLPMFLSNIKMNLLKVSEPHKNKTFTKMKICFGDVSHHGV